MFELVTDWPALYEHLNYTPTKLFVSGMSVCPYVAFRKTAEPQFDPWRDIVISDQPSIHLIWSFITGVDGYEYSPKFDDKYMIELGQTARRQLFPQEVANG